MTRDLDLFLNDFPLTYDIVFMSFNNFGEFLRWSHADNYGEIGLGATVHYNDVPYNESDETDARMIAQSKGDESLWPTYLEQIVLTNLRVTNGFDDELEIDT